jgi:glycosyltransferase involved in cell wall biosynthesis
LHELIFLDDCSSDDSVEVATRLLGRADVDWRIVRNETNSGSVFSQWKKGIELASGDFVWIAEADDESEPDFLRTVMRGLQIPGMVMSYCESQQIDAGGNRLAADYSAYVATVDSRHWRNHFASDGAQEVSQYLSIMNTIPNVSAVLFERTRLSEVMAHAFEDIRRFRVAGDWRLYVEVLRKGGVSFNPAALNRHRRHQQGVTLGERRAQLIEEIRAMQHFVATQFSVSPERADQARAYLDTLSASQDA